MKPTVSVGLILLAVIISEAHARVRSQRDHRSASATPKNRRGSQKPITNGAHIKLNLTEVVREYIVKYIGKEVLNFSLKEQVGNEWPTVKAKTGELVYGDQCKKVTYFPDMDCSDYYIYYIYNGISSPFDLPINLTLSYKGIRNDTHELNINNASYIYWNPDNITMYPANTSQSNFSEEKCDFSIQVMFSGSFVYKVKDVEDDKPKEGSHYIGRVGLLNKYGLSQWGDEVLLYNISGVFTHTVTCTPKLNLKKAK
ncbi:hypothetical protein MTO96_037367 [Rhipicephalus appendiculatus]|uniref:DA-P36 family member n=1 Tax=Rhipicephalus appendiculatus TaxID=34631 RepID=A0A131Z5H3_RHIAP